MAEAEAVFAQGCKLPERWSGTQRACVLEIGFGVGLNLLAAYRAFHLHAHPAGRLDFVSIEAHPLARTDLLAAHEACGVASEPLLRELAARWPLALPGLHRLTLAGGRIRLTLAFGDAARMLPRLALRADTIFLDGFAPLRNPSAWEGPALRQVARLAAPDARLATYTAAAAVRHGLVEAGFDVERVEDFGGKRERINARYAPRWKTRWPPPPPPRWESRRAVVVGAGLAGVTMAARLVQDGWQVVLLDRQPLRAREGSGQPLLADHIHLSPDDNLLARLSRAALHLRNPNHSAGLRRLGRLAVADSAEAFDRQKRTLDTLGFPTQFACAVTATEASDIAGCSLPTGGIWMPGSMVAQTSLRIQALLADAGDALTWRGGCDVASVHRVPGESSWRVADGSGQVLAQASVVVLCDASTQMALPPLQSLPLRRVRRQTSWLQHPLISGLRTVLGGAAYAVPFGGQALVGSTYDDTDAAEPDAESDRSNARRLAACLGAAQDSLYCPGSSAPRWRDAGRGIGMGAARGVAEQ
jgi:tRNA 5-methylaminomethyl-2-thiouridine biosynthesis bifunctional protein